MSRQQTQRRRLNPQQKSAAAPNLVHRHFRGEPVSHHRRLRRTGKQSELFANDWKRNPQQQSGNHPVPVDAYYRQSPASDHQKLRATGKQSDLFANMDWKRNPGKVIDALDVHYSYGKTIVSLPNGRRLTLNGTLSVPVAKARAMKRLIRRNPEILPEYVDAAQAEHFVNDLILALDTNSDGDLDDRDADAYGDFESEPSRKVTFETDDDDDDFDEDFDDDDFDEDFDDDGEDDFDGDFDDDDFDREFDEAETKENGFLGDWNDRRRAANSYRRTLKLEQKLKKAQATHTAREQKARKNPGDRLFVLTAQRTSDGKKIEQLFNDRGAAASYAAQLLSGGRYAMVKVKPGTKAMMSRLQQAAKSNPGIIGLLAETGIAATSALAIHDRLKQERAKKRAKNAAAKPKQNTAAAGAKPKLNGASAKRATANGSKTNPSAHISKRAPIRFKPNPAGIFERFTGRASTRVDEVETSPLAPAKIEELGKLHSLKVQGYKEPFVFAPKSTADAMNPEKYSRGLSADNQDRLWIDGAPYGDANPDLKPKELSIIGTITHGTYLQEKAHLADADRPGEPSLYKHPFGDEGGEKPTLALDRDGYLIITGGDFTVEPEGIRN